MGDEYRVNKELCKMITGGMEKEAQELMTNATRLYVREGGIVRRWLPPEEPPKIERRPDREGIVTYVDLETKSSGAMSIPFDGRPAQEYVHASWYPIDYTRLTSKTYAVDEMRLKAYDYNLMGLMQYHMVKDVYEYEDTVVFSAIDNFVGAAGSTVPSTGGIQHQSFSGGVTRENFNDALKLMNDLPSRLDPAVAVVSQQFLKEIQKWDRSEFGGDISGQIAVDGFGNTRKLFGVDIVASIKSNIIPNNVAYFFSTPDYIGKFFTLQDVTVYTQKKDWMYYFKVACVEGVGFGQLAGICKATFTP